MLRSNRDPDWPLPDRPDHPFYAEVLRLAYEEGDFELFRETALNDFWFFARHLLSLGKVTMDDPFSEWHGKNLLDHPWIFARFREVQASPNGHLDLWPRYHRKTAIITQSLTLWDLCDIPSLRFMIITWKLDNVGASFTQQIKKEAEDNQLLKDLFPSTFFQDPLKESPLWKLDQLCFKQALNAKEPSITLASLRSGLTSFHVDVRVWDDIVTEENVRTAEAIEQTTKKVRDFAGTASDYTVDRFTGTHWASNDTYDALIAAGLVKLRYHDLYQEDGRTPVLMSETWCENMHRSMTLIGGETHWLCVMRNRPDMTGEIHFQRSWLKFYDDDPHEARKLMNCYIVIDTARAKKKDSDFTVLTVVGLGKGVPFGHYWWLDGFRDRIGLVELTDRLFKMVDIWKPTYVFIEEQGAARDSEHFRKEMDDRKSMFRLHSFEDKMPKEDRIRRWQPIYESGRFHLPHRMPSRCEGRPIDLVDHFVRFEYSLWSPTRPSKFDDMLDNFAHLLSPSVAQIARFPVGSPLPYEAPPDDVWKSNSVHRHRKVGSLDLVWAI